MNSNPNKPDIKTLEYSPDRADRADYVSVVAGQVSDWKFLSDTYHGSGGYKTGKYIVPFPVEGFYDRRRDVSYYVNSFSAIVDAMVVPVFAKKPTRSIVTEKGIEVDNEFYDAFIDDCDGSGTDLTMFMQDKIATYARIHSITFAIVDNFPQELQPQSAVDAIENRLMPYVYHKTIEQVEDYEKDDLGKLISITFVDKKIQSVDDYGIVTSRQLYRKWTNEYSVILVKDKNKKQLIEFEEPVYHYLGILPVVVVLDKSPDKVEDLAPYPRLYSVARVCHAIYNRDSEITDWIRRTAASMLAMPGKAKDIVIGNGIAIGFPVESSKAPHWISPDPALLKELRDTKESLRQDMYTLVEQQGVVAKREAKSGIALAYEFQAHKTILDKTANICEQAERQIYNIFARYMQWGNQYYMNVDYNREYLPYNTQEAVEQDQFLVDSGAPLEMIAEIWRDHMHRRFPDMDSDEINSIVDNAVAEKRIDTNIAANMDVE